MKELRIFKIFLKDDSDDKAPFDLVEKIQKKFRSEKITYEYWRDWKITTYAVVDSDEKIDTALKLMDGIKKTKWGKKNIALIAIEGIYSHLPESVKHIYKFYVTELKKTD